jgi:hypothetical protein
VKALANLTVAFGDFAQAAAKALAEFQRLVDKVNALVATPQQREVRVSGLESRMYVRAAMDPTYADSPGALVRALLRDPASVLGAGDALWVVRREARCRLAAAALRGWADFHSGPDRPVTAWHRAFGDTAVLVGGAA